MQVLPAAAGKGCSSVYEEITLNNPTDTMMWVPVSLRGHCTSEQSCSEWSPLSYDEPLNSSRITVPQFIEHKWSPNDLMRIKTMNHHRGYKGDVGPASWEALVSKHWRMTVELPNSVSEMCRVDAKVDWSMFWPNTFTLVCHLSLLLLLISYPRDFSSFGLFPSVETNWSALTLSEI